MIAVAKAAQVGFEDQLIVLDHQKAQGADEAFGIQQLRVNRGQRIRVEVPETKRSDGQWEMVAVIALIMAPVIALAVFGGMR